MPDIDDFDLSKVELERPVVPISDEEIDKSLERLAANNKKYEAAEGFAAEDKDQILMDFKGTVEGKDFPGKQYGRVRACPWARASCLVSRGS